VYNNVIITGYECFKVLDCISEIIIMIFTVIVIMIVIRAILKEEIQDSISPVFQFLC
jgi:hypothetical protein